MKHSETNDVQPIMKSVNDQVRERIIEALNITDNEYGEILYDSAVVFLGKEYEELLRYNKFWKMFEEAYRELDVSFLDVEKEVTPLHTIEAYEKYHKLNAKAYIKDTDRTVLMVMYQKNEKGVEECLGGLLNSVTNG